MQIRGRHATYWKSLAQLPGNAIETSNNFKVFENYIYVYMLAPIVGFTQGRKGYVEASDESKDTAGMLAEVQIKHAAKLKYIYRLIVLNDDSEGLAEEDKINRAFREDSDSNTAKKGMELYTAYFLGGLEILYETFVQSCITDDDYVRKIYEFVNDFKNEQSIDTMEPDIENLLSK